MDAAHPRRFIPDRFRPVLVPAAVAAVAVTLLWAASPPALVALPAAFAVTGVLALVVRARTSAERIRAERVDRLTGLPNRHVLSAWLRAHRAERRLALLVLDLYRFRAVNDALGHPAGDRLLVEVARRLAAGVPAHDLLVRLGGDEFAVLATRVDGPAAARRIAVHLAEALHRPFMLDGLTVDVSASIGVAVQRGATPA